MEKRKTVDLIKVFMILRVQGEYLHWVKGMVDRLELVEGMDFTVELDLVGDKGIQVFGTLCMAKAVTLLHGTLESVELYKVLTVVGDRRRKGILRKGQRLLYGYITEKPTQANHSWMH